MYALGLFLMGVETNLLLSIGVHGLASSVLDLLACVPFLMLGGRSSGGHGKGGRGARGLSYAGKRYKSLR